MIIIDQRETRSSIPRKLMELGVPISYSMLEVGDYVVCGKENLIVSRKEVHDYLGSMITGHLNNELLEMSTNYPYACLIVEGFITEALMARQMKRLNYNANLAHALLKRSATGKSGVISIVCLDTAYDTAYFLKSAHDCLTLEDGLIRTPVLETKKHNSDPSLYILASFPHVGEVRAGRLLKYFEGSLERVLNADESQLCQVEGIGKTIAQSIRKTYKGE